MTQAATAAPSAGSTGARRWTIPAVAGLGMVAGSWYALRAGAVQRADVRAGDALRRRSSPRLDAVVVATTDLGSLYAVGGCAAALALTGQRETAADVAALGGVAWTVAQRSKTTVSRERPYEAEGTPRLIRRPTGSSFPSGHAAVGVAVLSLLAERVGSRPARWALRGLGAYVAASRVYVGVHYPSDALGGAGVGLALAAVWRGPVAATGRKVAEASVGLGRRLLPPVARAAVRVGLGMRLPRRPAPQPRAA